MTLLRSDVYEACETIDAALFTGDSFEDNQKMQDELEEYLERWSRRLVELAPPNPCDTCATLRDYGYVICCECTNHSLHREKD
jgi:hypothetical protein